MPDSILSLGSTPISFQASSLASKKDSPEQIHSAAQQFESLLMTQLLRSSHDDDEGWLGTGDDETASSAMGFAEEQLGQALSARGGIGLSDLIEQGLTKSTNANSQ